MRAIPVRWERGRAEPADLTYEVWRHTADLDETDSAAIEASATLVSLGTARSYDDPNAPVSTQVWYFIRAVDRGDLKGPFRKAGPAVLAPLSTSDGGTGTTTYDPFDPTGLAALAIADPASATTEDIANAFNLAIGVIDPGSA
ncbi:MAG: hypothetical protein QNI84_07910 [Henriciella sp.]|nr:hypothetical protein [Henriciella sp.]